MITHNKGSGSNYKNKYMFGHKYDLTMCSDTNVSVNCNVARLIYLMCQYYLIKMFKIIKIN